MGVETKTDHRYKVKKFQEQKDSAMLSQLGEASSEAEDPVLLLSPGFLQSHKGLFLTEKLALYRKNFPASHGQFEVGSWTHWLARLPGYLESLAGSDKVEGTAPFLYTFQFLILIRSFHSRYLPSFTGCPVSDFVLT